jgi:hypothetical protein
MFNKKIPPLSDLAHRGMALITALSMLLTVTSMFLFMMERNHQIKNQIVATKMRGDREYFFQEIQMAFNDPQICMANLGDPKANVITDASGQDLFGGQQEPPALLNTIPLRFKQIEYLNAGRRKIKDYVGSLITQKINGQTYFIQQKTTFEKMDVRVTLNIPEKLMRSRKGMSSEFAKTFSIYLVSNFT